VSERTDEQGRFGRAADRVMANPLVCVCSGAYDCPASRHMHGCFSDSGDCELPGEHEPVTEET